MAIRDEFHMELRSRREARALSETYVASLVSLSGFEYFDLESVATEWRMVTPLFKTKFLAKFFDIDIGAFVGPSADAAEIDSPYDIAALIKSHRERLGLSPDEFADKAGFHPVFAAIVEGHPLGLELWPAEVAILVAQALKISEAAFLRWIFKN